MNRTPLSLAMPPVEALTPRVQAQIATILARSTTRQPVMLGLAQATNELAPMLGCAAGGLYQRWRAGFYPTPDLWLGTSVVRNQRFVRIPVAWIDDAMIRGQRAFSRPVTRGAIAAGLDNWPDLMGVSTVAEAVSAGKTACRELVLSGALGSVTMLDGRPHIRKSALIDHLVACVKAAIDSWKADAA